MPDANNFALHRPELLDALTRGDEKIARLMAGRTRTLERGATLIPQGADHDYVYRMRSGWTGRQRTLPDGRTQTILVFLPGDLFAVKSMFLTQHGDAVVALSDAVVEQIEQRRLKAAYDEDADIATRCISQVVEEERRLHNWIVSLGQGEANERLAHMLLEFKGRLTRAGVIADDAQEFRLPMTQDQIAGLIGVTTVHVSRLLKRFREENVALIRDGVARLIDLDALDRLAAPVQDPFERHAPEYGARGNHGP